MRIEVSSNFKNWLIANKGKVLTLPTSNEHQVKKSITVPNCEYDGKYLLYDDHSDIQTLEHCYCIYDYKGDK